jgi:hypothetical protein
MKGPTARQVLIVVSADKVHDMAADESQVHAIIDDMVRTCGQYIKDYYMGCNQTALKRLDRAVWRKSKSMYGD